jgi:hypothetical protein
LNQSAGGDATELVAGNDEGDASPSPGDPGRTEPVSAESAAAIPASALGTPDGDSGRALLTYASSWFTYHAGQRLQSFNFFVALQTALIAVVALQYGTAGRITLCTFGAVGFVGTLLFAALEIRNTELVLAAGATLTALESSFLGGTGSPAATIPLPHSAANARLYLKKALFEVLTPKDIQPIGCRPASRRWYRALGYVIRHSFVLRLIFLLTLVGWLVFVILTLASYQPSRPSCSVTVRGGVVARVVCATASPPAGRRVGT